MGTLEAQNRQIVERYWEAHFLRDWEAMAGFFSADAHYTDVGVDGQGARARSRSSTGSRSASSRSPATTTTRATSSPRAIS